MRAATVVIVGVGAALLAPMLAAPRAESHTMGQGVPRCAMVLALPEELGGLIKARQADAAPCSPEIVFMTTPLTLVEISAQAVAHIWAQPAPNPRIDKAQQIIRQAYETVMGGLEAVAGNPAEEKMAAENKPAVRQ
jgi:hypothetical protein